MRLAWTEEGGRTTVVVHKLDLREGEGVVEGHEDGGLHHNVNHVHGSMAKEERRGVQACNTEGQFLLTDLRQALLSVQTRWSKPKDKTLAELQLLNDMQLRQLHAATYTLCAREFKLSCASGSSFYISSSPFQLSSAVAQHWSGYFERQMPEQLLLTAEQMVTQKAYSNVLL